MIKAIFFDIDGTLISNKKGVLPESTKRCLKILKEKGIKRIVCTGRHKIEMNALHNIDWDFDGYITLNGNLCLDEDFIPYAGKNIQEDEAMVLGEIFKAKKIPFAIVTEDNLYINYVDQQVITVQGSTNGEIPSIDEYHGEKIYQVITYIDKDKQKMLTEFLDECSVTSWNEHAINIISRGTSKATGIKKSLEHFGIDQSETMAFGDGNNDEEMLKYVSIGVAMGNATDKLKSIADYVTDEVDNDGIEKALKHFKIID